MLHQVRSFQIRDLSPRRGSFQRVIFPPQLVHLPGEEGDLVVSAVHVGGRVGGGGAGDEEGVFEVGAVGGIDTGGGRRGLGLLRRW